MKYTAEECEKLEGKEVEFYYDAEKDPDYIGIIVGCDPSIGITMVNKEDKTDNLVCLSGPMSRDHKHFKQHYKKLFTEYVNMIILGKFYVEKAYEIKGPGILGEMVACPFT